MNDPEQARILLDAARRDLTALHGMDDAEIFADEIFGFHVQQTAEELLKAWLTLEGVSYPKTHDLRLLINQLAQHGVDVLFDRVQLLLGEAEGA